MNSTNRSSIKMQTQEARRTNDRRPTTSEHSRSNNMNIFRSTILFCTFILRVVSATNQQIVLVDSVSSSGNNITKVNIQTTQPFSPQIQASFSTPNQAINITHVTYDPLHDTIYLGATNTIYQLNGTDLSEQLEQTTGPVYDNPSCGITECHGFEDYMKPTQNINKVLVIDYQHRKLLSCGSVKQGACRRYELNNIAQKEDLIPMAVAANDDNSSTYAFIAPARYNNEPSSSAISGQAQQQVLYVGATYTRLGQSRDLLVPAIGTRLLSPGPDLLKLYESALDSARIDINSHLRDYFLVNYLYGFASSNYIYFITVQKKATSRDYEELGYHTRIARICITDSSYNSYTEVDLKCMPSRKKSTPKHQAFFGSQENPSKTPNEYPLLHDAILVDAGSQLLQSLSQNDQSSPISTDFFFNSPSMGSASSDDTKVLLGVFSSAKDHTQHAGEHSALCAFSLSQIEEKFNDNIHSCYTGKMQSRNMEYIAGNVQECPKSGQGGNVVNFCHETLKINGTLPIISEASIQFLNTTLTAITATSHINSNTKNIYSDQFSVVNDSKITATTSPNSNIPLNPSSQHTVVFMGTNNGHLKKVLLNNASNGIEFDDIQLDTNPILSDLHLDSSGQHVIVATPYKVMKVATQNCAQYSTCRECSQSKNPYCGWCSLKRSCTTKSECISGSPPQIETREPTWVNRQQQPATAGISLDSSSTSSVASSKSQFKWISSDSAGKCIDLQSIVPDKIPITSTGKVDLYIDRLPRLPKEHNYKCIFDKKEHTNATSTHFGLTCPLPKVMHRPKIQPGRDHAVVELSVRSSETNTDFLNGKVTFFECQLHTTCKDCLTTNWGCNWCLNENVCLFNTSKCDKTGPSRLDSKQTSQAPIITISNAANQRSALSLTTVSSNGNGLSSSLVLSNQRTGNTINLVNQCPTFDVGHKQDILISDGSERELSIRVKNMPHFRGNIKCIVEIESDKYTLKARIEDDRVICENKTYSYEADVGLLNGQLMVIYSDNNISIDRTNFTLYKCHLLGAYLNRPDCSLCQRIDSRFNCAWCSGACQHKPHCTDRPDDACPPPRIDYVSPMSGPTLGGTKVTIEGSNLGQSFDEIANRVTIGNVPCRPIEAEYHPSNRIVCLTSPVIAKYSAIRKDLVAYEGIDMIMGDIMVGNKAGYSIGPGKFQFKSIYLKDHQPRYGPQSGGTRIILTGMNFNIGSNIQVFLDEIACIVEPNLTTAEQIVCKTSASKYPSRFIRQLKLVIDGAQIIREGDDVFYYTQDPIITKIQPLRSYLSGGRPINVYGANLTTVQVPRMAIIDAAGKKVNESICIVQDDTRMQCPSPTVSLQMMDLEFSEQHISQYEAQATSSSTWTPIVSMRQQTASGPLKLLNQPGNIVFQQDESVKFRIGFIMDNVWRLRDLQANYPSVSNEISYTNDPKLYSFASHQYKSAQDAVISANSNELVNSNLQSYQIDSDTYLLQPGEPSLVLYGDQLRGAMSEYEITVTVGQDLCNLTLLTNNRLVCNLPLDHMATPTDEDGHQTVRALPLVVVRIGFNLRFELGYVQYHPQLVEQIVQAIANSSEQLPIMRPPYQQYMPRENESVLQKISGYIASLVLLLVYLTLGSIILIFVYSGFIYGCKLRHRSNLHQEYRRMLKKMDMLEKSVKNECRIASISLKSDLNELARHIELSGIPVLDVKQYIMKVFFPGINNHPLLVKQPAPIISQDISFTSGLNQGNNLRSPCSNLMMQQTIPRPNLKSGREVPMDYFERLILTKPFLVAFINTIETQPTFTIRDKVNVASLLMIVLMDKLDYATDILRTLLFQLVERSVENYRAIEDEMESKNNVKPSSRLSHHASNLLGGLPISKRSSRAAKLGKVVGGSASSLMASTTVAAQMFISRVGNKTSPLQPSDDYLAHNNFNHGSSTLNHCMSTTTFNQQSSMANTISGKVGRRATKAKYEVRGVLGSQSPHLMFRRTDSIVEKMLTDWLALNMFEHFHGDIGQSLYMMFESLKGQLERGPIDSVTGDAYYSLNENKLLREPFIQFEVINLYVIIDTEILKPKSSSKNHNNNTGSLIDTSISYNQSLYGECLPSFRSSSNYTTTNTITLSVRVLDCDTISQVKSKILGALYRNSPQSSRLGVEDVELLLRQHQTMIGQSTTGAQYSTISLQDEDYSNLTGFNGMSRINTLKHYGVNDQAIVSLNKSRLDKTARATSTANRTPLTEMLDQHYNNPYSEIQYGSVSQPAPKESKTKKLWHLARSDDHTTRATDAHSNESSPPSNSPSIMLLGNETGRVPTLQANRQQFYHPSSSSTSSTGNVMDTNSTSANSSSVNVTNLLTRSHVDQPIYCQIGSSNRSQHGGATSSYYCQVGLDNNGGNNVNTNQASCKVNQRTGLSQEQEKHIYLTRMLTSKGIVQNQIDDFFRTILSTKTVSSLNQQDNEEHDSGAVLCGDLNNNRRSNNASGACPPAVKWLFDLLDEAAARSGIADQDVIHSWKSNAFLMRFWVNLIKNPNYILDVEKSNTLDATLSVVAQTLMDSCSANEPQLNKDSTCNKLLFAKNVPKYKNQVKKFYQDVASMRSVSDQEIVKHMNMLSISNAGRFDTNLALKELCVYAVNYGVELIGALNNDYTCQQLELSQQLEQCFQSFTIFEAYR